MAFILYITYVIIPENLFLSLISKILRKLKYLSDIVPTDYYYLSNYRSKWHKISKLSPSNTTIHVLYNSNIRMYECTHTHILVHQLPKKVQIDN